MIAGHLGQKKTAERILQRFYWPTLFQDVREVCKAVQNVKEQPLERQFNLP